jgi:hypothetical protein
VGALTIGLALHPPALAVVEREAREGNGIREVQHYIVRRLEPLPAGTSYPEIARRVAEVAHRAHLRTKWRPALSVDATGVGTPIIEFLRTAGVPGKLIAVYFTHGVQRTEGPGHIMLVGWLVSRLQLLLQSDRLHLPPGPQAAALHQELLHFEIPISADANEAYGAFPVGTHDDLVTALGLALHDMHTPVRVGRAARF